MPERILSLCVRQAREARALSPDELAARRGVGVTGIYRIESGASPMSEAVLESTAAALGISVRLLLLEELDPKRARTPEEQARAGEPRLLSRIVRNALKSRALTQTAAGKLFGVGQGTVSGWTSGAALLEETTLETVAAGLGITERALLLEGLTYEPPAAIDLARLRERFLAATHEETGPFLATRIAEAIEEGRYTLSKFGAGQRIAQRVAQKLQTWLDQNAPMMEIDPAALGIGDDSLSADVVQAMIVSPRPLTIEQLAGHLGKPAKTIGNVMSGLKTRGIVEHAGSARGSHGHQVATWQVLKK
jgi:transcriptional regulator with XRE-family HTH domain